MDDKNSTLHNLKPGGQGNRQRTPGIGLRTLIKRHTQAKAAEMIGYSATGLSTIFDAAGEVPVTTELAAQFILVQEGGMVRSNRMLVLKVTPEQEDALLPVMKALGVKIAFAAEED